jgi:hypothetical protein
LHVRILGIRVCCICQLVGFDALREFHKYRP